ncbi:MAG: universal stress protein, partial [Anaerolineae bacterium]|nr:universal stress protein [Anaerolineae bacterium]
MAPQTQDNYHIIAATGEKQDFKPLLSLGYSLAKAHGGKLTVVTVQSGDEVPEWFQVPPIFNDIPIEAKVIPGSVPKDALTKFIKLTSPELVLLGWKGAPDKFRYLMGSGLDPILHEISCNLVVVKANTDWPGENAIENGTLSVLVPTSGGPNAPLALNLALNSAVNCEVTTLYVTHPMDTARRIERETWLAEFTKPWAHFEHLNIQVIEGDDVFETIIDQSRNYDVTMLGASNESTLQKLLYGALPQKVAEANTGTTVIVRQFAGATESIFKRMWWQLTHILPMLTLEERIDVYK